MANVVYTRTFLRVWSAEVDWQNDTIKAIAVCASDIADPTDYTLDADADDYLDDIPVASRIATATLTNCTLTQVGSTVVLNADEIEFTSVSGDEFEYIIIIKDTGVEATSPVLIALDEADNLPYTPVGVSVIFRWPTNGITIGQQG